MTVTERRPRVLVLCFSHLERDPRILRQIALLALDYEVWTCGFGPAPAGSKRHVELSPATWRGNYRRYYALVLARRFARIYFRSTLVRQALAAIEPAAVDAVLANDAATVPLALRLCPTRGVHADLHEFAPRQGEDDPVWRRFSRPFVTWMLRSSLARCASVTTVSDGIAAAYREDFGVRARVVANAGPYRADLAPTEVGKVVRFVHIGVAGRGRRLEIMIEAVGRRAAEEPGSLILDCYLQPGDAAYIRELEALADRVGGGAVRVLPPVPFADIVSTLSGYDVGVFVCPPTTFNLRYTLPNKFFEFVQARLAILVGPSAEMAPIVRDRGLGIVAEDFTVEATRAALAQLDHDRVAAAKQAADRAAEELSGEHLSAPWSEDIARILGPAEGAP